jgi:hypothetical protein
MIVSKITLIVKNSDGTGSTLISTVPREIAESIEDSLQKWEDTYMCTYKEWEEFKEETENQNTIDSLK